MKDLSSKGRNFVCTKCPDTVMKLRRCQEDRFDFTEKDNGSVFPIKMTEYGASYGFCPAKSSWDPRIVSLFRLLVLSYETKQLLYSGGIAQQPAWFVDLLSWFIPRYDELKFYSRAKAILGEDTKKSKLKGSQSLGTNTRRTKHKSID